MHATVLPQEESTNHMPRKRLVHHQYTVCNHASRGLGTSEIVNQPGIPRTETSPTSNFLTSGRKEQLKIKYAQIENEQTQNTLRKNYRRKDMPMYTWEWI